MSVTIAIENISSHLKNAYDELQGLGADLSNVNKNIENISIVLDNIYDSMPQVSGEGTSLTLDDTRVGKIKSTLKGNASQETTTGKNLLPNGAISQTINGVTFTVNKDGSIKANGTASGNAGLFLTGEVNEYIDLNIPNGDYILSGSTGGADSMLTWSVYLSIKHSDDTTEYKYSYNGDVSFTKQEGDKFYALIRIGSGTTINNQIFYPMIRANGQPNTYEPYTGGIAAPNPSYPQDVHVVSGDNEIKVNSRKLPAGYTQVDYIASSGTQYINTEFKPTGDTSTIVDCEYTPSAGTTSAIFGTQHHNTSTMTYINAYNFGNITNTGYVYVTKYNVSANNKNVTASDYIGRKQYKMLKNIAYIDNTLINTFTYSTFTCTYNAFLFAHNYNGSAAGQAVMKLYSCKIYDNDTLVRDFIPCYRNNDNEVGLYDLVNDVFYTNQGTGSFTYGKIIENSQSLPLNLGDLEYCKIGDYSDEFFKNDPKDPNYNSNLELNKWYLKKNIDKVVLDGSETWNSSQLATDSYYCSSINSAININSEDTTNYIYSNCYQHTYRNNINNLEYGIAINNSTQTNYGRILIRHSGISTVSDFNNYLSNNNAICYYVLATPTTTKITDSTLISQLNALEKAMSYNTQTNISQENNNLPFIINATALIKNSD